MDKKTIKYKLEDILNKDNIIEDADMSQYTSFKAGGAADILVIPQDVSQLRKVLEFLRRENINHVVLGNGSNILVKDGGYRGVVIKMGEAFAAIRQEGDSLICGSGALLSAVSRNAAAAGLTGLEFASGIPGSIGGAVFMNAGAYGGEIVHVLQKVKVISKDGADEFYMDKDELQMGYRHSVFHETGDIIVEVILALTPGDPEAIKAVIADFTERRNSKQPVSFPSAGSFFKRPEGYFAGKLIQDAGFKGLSVGGAQVSDLHSGFIINKGGATATDILQLMEMVQAGVLDKFGVRLEPEVRIIGE